MHEGNSGEWQWRDVGVVNQCENCSMNCERCAEPTNETWEAQDLDLEAPQVCASCYRTLNGQVPSPALVNNWPDDDPTNISPG